MYLHKNLSYRVISGIIEVHRALGPGLLELPYHNALYHQLSELGLRVQSRVSFPVHFKDYIVGEYFADLVVEETIILELKSVKKISPEMEAQLINYLKISGLPLGLLVNFQGIRVNWKRFANTA